MKQESAKKRVRISVYTLATFSFFAWLEIFAAKIEGVNGTFDPFAKPDPVVAWAFNLLQIATEVLVGAALFLNLEAIAAVYAPDYFTASLKHEQLTKRRAALDAATLRLIGTFAVPEKAAYRHPRAKLKANRPALRALAEFAKASDGDPAPRGRIDLPGFLLQVGRNWPATEPAELIVLGSPIHDNPRAPGFSMKGGKVPNDGHVTVGRNLHLYARPGPASPVIYDGNKRTANGQLLEDFRRSPAISNGFETIAFSAPVDLSKLLIGVSFFAGRGGADGVHGKVRIGIGPDTWATPFRIASKIGLAGLGTEAAMREGRAPNKAWVIIDPLAVTGLR
ncbi:MAG: hypothetical protein AAF713_19090 [Pseudomonadota bacterium]